MKTGLSFEVKLEDRKQEEEVGGGGNSKPRHIQDNPMCISDQKKGKREKLGWATD